MKNKFNFLKKNYIKLTNNQLDNIFCSYAIPILKSTKMLKNKDYIQHGNISIYTHCISVAYYSFKLANSLGFDINIKSLIKGALLHDYFLYDWHDKDKSHRLHGFKHPYVAYKNAVKDYNLNDIEKNIILRHMFPLTPIPPNCKESLIICIVDKLCSTKEILDFGLERVYFIELKLRCFMTT